MRFGDVAPNIVDHKVVARFLQIAGHAGAHGAKADESNLHGVVFKKNWFVVLRRESCDHRHGGPALDVREIERSFLGKVGS